MAGSRVLFSYLRFAVPLTAGVVAALILLTSPPLRSAQSDTPAKSPETQVPASTAKDDVAPPAASSKPESEISSLQKTKTDAAELSALADQLRDELKKMNVNVLSLDVLQKTEEVEKLARKIKGEANGH